MKHLIIEGPDRTGKDALISLLLPFCQNAVVTHFSTPIGNTDEEKRQFQETSFRQEFAKANTLTSEVFNKPPKPGREDILFWNRAHLGEFVYGKLYRETHPEEWVMDIEKEYGYDKREDVFLLLLTADPEFLSKKDDGLSFSATAESRKREIENFRSAFHLSNIQKKLELVVSKDGEYVPFQTIVDRVLQFLNS